MNIITLVIIAFLLSAIFVRNKNTKEKINTALEIVKDKYPLVETYIIDYSRKYRFVLLFNDDVDDYYRKDATDLFYRELEILKV